MDVKPNPLQQTLSQIERSNYLIVSNKGKIKSTNFFQYHFQQLRGLFGLTNRCSKELIEFSLVRLVEDNESEVGVLALGRIAAIAKNMGIIKQEGTAPQKGLHGLLDLLSTERDGKLAHKPQTANAIIQDFYYEKVSGAVIPLASYACGPSEEPNSFRKKIYQETARACENGYVNSVKELIILDHQPMLNKTKPFENLESLGKIDHPYENTLFSVKTEDTLKVLRDLTAAEKNPVGLNMANRYTPGGGTEKGSPAQEEAICRSSNHLKALKKQKYPFPEFGGIYCPHVKVFRDSEERGFVFLDKPQEVALVASAAYDLREYSKDRFKLGLPGKGKLTEKELRAHPNFDVYKEGTGKIILSMLREMALKGHKTIVLGALGCGAFANPPEIIAEIFLEILKSDEFKGRFEQVDFAILRKTAKDQKNIDAFNEICQKLNSPQTQAAAEK